MDIEKMSIRTFGKKRASRRIKRMRKKTWRTTCSANWCAHTLSRHIPGGVTEKKQ